MLITDKTFIYYNGEFTQSNVVAWRESGFTIAAGIIVDISDVAHNPTIVVSQLSTEFLRNAAAGLVSLDDFIASELSLADYPLHTIPEEQLLKLDPTPENFAKINSFMDECSERLQANFALVNQFLEELGKAD
jgi:hypothetical protein